MAASATGRSRRILLRVAAALALLLVLSVTARALGVRDWFASGDVLRGRIDRAGAAGPLLFVALYLVAPYLLLPRLLPATLSGALFGVWRGFGYTYAASLLAASGSFWMGRWIGGRSPDEAGEGGRAGRRIGWRTICAIRMVPLMPGDPVNLAIAQTATPYRTYLLGTALGVAPSLAAYAAVGEGLAWRDRSALWIGGGVLLLLLVAGLLALRRSRAVAREPAGASA